MLCSVWDLLLQTAGRFRDNFIYKGPMLLVCLGSFFLTATDKITTTCRFNIRIKTAWGYATECQKNSIRRQRFRRPSIFRFNIRAKTGYRTASEGLHTPNNDVLAARELTRASAPGGGGSLWLPRNCTKQAGVAVEGNQGKSKQCFY